MSIIIENLQTQVKFRFHPRTLTKSDITSPTFNACGAPFELEVQSDDEDPLNEVVVVYLESKEKTKWLYVSITLLNVIPEKSFQRSFAFKFNPGRYREVDLVLLAEMISPSAGWIDKNGMASIRVSIQFVRQPGSKLTTCDTDVKTLSGGHEFTETTSTPVPDPTVDFLSRILRYGQAINDLTICSSDGSQFQMSEFIFASSSEELATHLKYKENGKLVFQHITGQVMGELIRYLKTGKIDETCEPFAFELAEIAHLYNLPSLFKFVEPYLTKQVSSNVARAMRIANLFDSSLLYEKIGAMGDVRNDKASLNAEVEEILVNGRSLQINKTLLKLKYPMFLTDGSQDKLISTLKDKPYPVSEGFIKFLETSTLPDLSSHIFDYAELAERFNLLDLDQHVESELTTNIRNYNREKVKDFAERRKSLALFRALVIR